MSWGGNFLPPSWICKNTTYIEVLSPKIAWSWWWLGMGRSKHWLNRHTDRLPTRNGISLRHTGLWLVQETLVSVSKIQPLKWLSDTNHKCQREVPTYGIEFRRKNVWYRHLNNASGIGGKTFAVSSKVCIFKSLQTI